MLSKLNRTFQPFLLLRLMCYVVWVIRIIAINISRRLFYFFSILFLQWQLSKIKYIFPQHGMGVPSMTILLQEIIKMLFYAKAKDPIFFRIGTCGGLKIPAGSVVISSWALNGTMEKSYNLVSNGNLYCSFRVNFFGLLLFC